MPGTQIFTIANIKKETTRGTPLAPTRKLYMEGTGVLDHELHVDFHENENRGVRTRITRATQAGEDVSLRLRTSAGTTYDDLPFAFAALKGGVTGTGATADKTWTMTPSMTAANSPDSFTLDVGDDVQAWRCQYVMWNRIRMSAEQLGMTQLELEGFAQRAVKGTAATPTDNTSTKIPGSLWTVKFAGAFASLAGASATTNLLLGWNLDINTGLAWRHYLDGNLYGAQHVETDISATVELTVESQSFVVSEFYDKYASQTLDFVRLSATGPTLGGSNYSATIDMAVLWDKPGIIAEAQDGINVWRVTGRLAYDSTGTASIKPVIVNSLTALA